MKTNKNQNRKLRVEEKEKEMVKSLQREQNLVGAKHQQAKAHLQQVPARDWKDKVPVRVHKDKMLKPHHMGHRYPMIMKQKFSRMKVVLYHKSFQVCYPSSCRKQWNPQYMRSLHNMLFQMKTFKKYHNKQGKEVIPKICTNAYFCFKNLDCLKLVHDGIDYCNLYIGNYYFNQLTPGHVELLKQKGYWDPIIQNHNHVIASGPSVLI